MPAARAAAADTASFRRWPLEPVTFVTHDWGAAVTWLLVREHPSLARSIIAADVGDSSGMATVHVLFCALYMSTLSALFMVGWRLGDAGTRGAARLFGAPHPQAVGAFMYYLYYRKVRHDVEATRRWLTGGAWWGGSGTSPRRGAVPSCPMVYLYGTRKGVRSMGGGQEQRGAGREGGEERGKRDEGVLSRHLGLALTYQWFVARLGEQVPVGGVRCTLARARLSKWARVIAGGGDEA